ncbi:hypothetical protein ACFZCL_18980 [Streptomyces sp. NPDC008159]|uniref:hypothetical protein n=1 Tax=Streptomyces sp. NPDC008159 TaxID=3364817 RepID=UPI0036F09EC5
MSGDARGDGHDTHDRREGHDELGARRRASWGRRDDERTEGQERDRRVGGRGLAEHEDTQSHAGNGTVNHGPEEQGPTKGQGLEGRGPDEPAPDDMRADDPTPGETHTNDGTESDETRSDDMASDAVASGDVASGDVASGEAGSGDTPRSADAGSGDARFDDPTPSGTGSTGPGGPKALRGLNDPHDLNVAHDLNDLGHLRGRNGTKPSGAAADLLSFGLSEPAPGSGSGAAGSGPKGLDGAGSKGLGGFDSDELMLRNLLHHAVSEIEPRDGTLDHLRRAVPARRARKRQAVVGMAAAALFIGTAIPALVHVSNSTGSDANPSVVGHGSATHGSEGQSKGQTGGSGSSGGTSGGSKDTGKGSDKGKGDKGKGSSAGVPGGTEATPTAASAALCTSAQLSGVGSVGSPDSGGAVYGSFRVSNVSGSSCTVAGAGGVSVSPQGAADAARITVANHVSGDVATGLPDPSLSLSQVVLEPGAAYEVRFAWVPSEPCPTTSGGTTDGGTGGTDPTPDPTPTAEDPGATADGGSSMSTQLVREDGVADGSVVISHTAEGGVGTYSAGVGNACAGTVYRTGLLTAS